MNFFKRHHLLLRAYYGHMHYVKQVQCVGCGELHTNFTFEKNPLCFFCGVKTVRDSHHHQTSLFGLEDFK